MWSGVNIAVLTRSLYAKFYLEAEIKTIEGDEDASLAKVKRLINKARKVGDTLTAAGLPEMYEELLYIPPAEHLPLPTRSELDARLKIALDSAYQRLIK